MNIVHENAPDLAPFCLKKTSNSGAFCLPCHQFYTVHSYLHLKKGKILTLSFTSAISKFNQLEIGYWGMFISNMAANRLIVWTAFCSQTDTHTHRQTDGTKNNTSTKTSFCGGGKYQILEPIFQDKS